MNQDEADKISEYYKTVSCSKDCRVLICINKWGLFAEDLETEGTSVAEMKERYIERLNAYFKTQGHEHLKIPAENVFCTDWKKNAEYLSKYGISGIEEVRDAIKSELRSLGVTDDNELRAAVSPPRD